jgi:hypothetical protein
VSGASFLVPTEVVAHDISSVEKYKKFASSKTDNGSITIGESATMCRKDRQSRLSLLT